MAPIESILHNLVFQDGIWQNEDFLEISYPPEANNVFFEIEDQSFWFKGRNDIIFEAVNKYSYKGFILDVGGGNGFVASFLSSKGFETVLVEPGIDGCLNARKRGLKYIINSPLDKEYFSSESIPNIGLFDILEHIEDQDKILENAKTILIPSGMLFITVPAFNSLWSEEDNYAGHYRRYRLKELKKIINNCGFEILYSTYFFSFLFLPVFILRAIPAKVGLYKTNSQKTKNQHFKNPGIGNLLDLLMKTELMKIRKGKSIKLGSSILLVSKKR